jgi:serine protease DegQ
MKRLWLIFSQTVAVALAAYFVVLTLKPQWLGPGTALPNPVVSVIDSQPVASGVAPVGSFRVAAQKAAAAVISINTTQKRKARSAAEEFWFRHFNGEESEESNGGLGSGVIVTTSGYILTNNHVIADADDIEVVLNDGRKSQAKVVGTDPDTDLAVLKIELPGLPTITLGNAEALQVGDQVLAIGNPFGVGQTVTSGIVSALGRNQLGINAFENFIQTDAAINPGNSGGALVDVNGSLLGINTAIYSRSGGSLGIGFAIPVSTARQVMDALVKDGQVSRGWLGASLQNLSPEAAKVAGLSRTSGVLVNGLLRNGPAAKAGLKPGDIIDAIGGKPMDTDTQVRNQVSSMKPGATVPVEITREGKKLVIQVELGERPKAKPQNRQ